MNTFKRLALAAAMLAAVGAAHATTLTNGPITMGLFNDGSLGSLGVGLTGVPGDAITPGCLCEGWGAAGNGVGNYTYGNASPSGIVSSAISGVTASTAISTVQLANGLQVVHNYTPIGGGELFKISITMTNTTGALMTDVRYARTLDWDVPPGHFGDDFTTIYGGTAAGPGGKVLHTSSDPFAAPNPMVTRPENANTNVTNLPGDKGAYFILGFGNLAIGASESFTTYIGASTTTTGLLTAFAGVGVEAYSYSFDDNGPYTFGWGFAGLGLPPIEPPVGVPEPGTLALLGLALVAAAARRRRQPSA